MFLLWFQDMGFSLFATKSTHEYLSKNGINCSLVYKPLIKKDTRWVTKHCRWECRQKWVLSKSPGAPQVNMRYYPPWNKHSLWKLVLGRLLSFSEVPFSGAMLVFGRSKICFSPIEVESWHCFSNDSDCRISFALTIVVLWDWLRLMHSHLYQPRKTHRVFISSPLGGSSQDL